MEYENKSAQNTLYPRSAAEPKAEPKPAKPTQDQLITLLKAMVTEAEAAGQRDRPYVQEAKAALMCCEPDPAVETKADERARVEQERVARGGSAYGQAQLDAQARVRADRD